MYAVGDRVIVRIDYQDRPGTVTRQARRGFYVVATDSGDTRTWPEHSMRKAAS